MYEIAPAASATDAILSGESADMATAALGWGGAGGAVGVDALCDVWPCCARFSFSLYSSRYQSRSYMLICGPSVVL
ncbi:hypothetical protein WT09_13110 [Burkholderia stagnalis]|nr:hypothetical protein WT09_13110 [Burkholderia stagnalis]